MCLTTNHKAPLIASKDIKVYKHVSEITPEKAQSPYQGTWFELNKEFVAQPSYTQLSPYDEEMWDINGGAIHACLWPVFDRGRCLEAYIPKGTEYWCGVDKSTICAKKLFVTDKEVMPEDCAGLDEEIALAVYSKAPRNPKGVKIGCFLSCNNTYMSATLAASCSKESILGVVVGFNNDKPIVADIQNFMKSISIDNIGSDKLDKCIPKRNEAIKDMEGYEHFKAWKETCKNNSERYEAYNAVAKLSKNHYIPALGEMALIWSNLIYIAAGCSLAGLACPLAIDHWYWTSTECFPGSCWRSQLLSIGNYWGPYYKHTHYKMVPFVASPW